LPPSTHDIKSWPQNIAARGPIDVWHGIAVSTRKDFHDYLLRGRPEWAEASARAEQLLDYLDRFELDRNLPCPRQFAFPCLDEIAFAGDSTGEAIWGASNDLLYSSVFLRIYTPNGIKREPMQCVRFLACVKGQLMGFYAERRVIVMRIEDTDFAIIETF
jgi:hypothetical protein